MSTPAKTAIIVGGSRGIGAAVARRLARDGVRLVVSYHSDTAAADQLKTEIEAAGGQIELVRADITQLADIAPIFDRAETRFGAVDIVVAVAGVGLLGSFQAATEAQFDALFGVTKGVFFLLQAAAGRIANGGRIITLSTGLTRTWAANAALYAGSKAAIEQFSRSLSKEVGGRGVTVNVVLPGVVETDMTAAMPAAMKQHAASQTSLGRLAAPDDIADVVGFLASPEARWITGQLIVANGGSTP
ncbi:SDR family oxidoreductase [Caulobacter hibisci]|uniref:SDR family oxidoreductase n=1 Tax=Caulobacter hibisci TaxID=2035993 RepID=A0ABS0SXZ4_9CAUL|nr:SDR family oxidoreductase [Caulobacter hibisci]MBI1684106.1 SDR family oxidoreductase [Caulobacter hibisci]